MTYESMSHRLLVRPIETKRTKGGIELPDNVYEKVVRAEVVDVGIGVDGIWAGDAVHFEKRDAIPIGDLISIPEDAVLVREELRPDSRYKLYDEIDRERAYQDEKFGPAFDNNNTKENWRDYIVKYANHPTYDFRKRMLKVAALAVAAIEAYERKYYTE